MGLPFKGENQCTLAIGKKSKLSVLVGLELSRDRSQKKSRAYFSNLRYNVLQGKLSELKAHAALCRNSCQKFRGQGGCMNFTVFFSQTDARLEDSVDPYKDVNWFKMIPFQASNQCVHTNTKPKTTTDPTRLNTHRQGRTKHNLI